MIGVLKHIFNSQCLDPMYSQYLQEKGSAFEIESPIIVDLDLGRIMELPEYKGMVDLHRLRALKVPSWQIEEAE